MHACMQLEVPRLPMREKGTARALSRSLLCAVPLCLSLSLLNNPSVARARRCTVTECLARSPRRQIC